MAAHNAASVLVAGEVLQRIRVYQDPCKALQRLVTKDHMRTPQVRQSNANDRLPNTGRVKYFRDIGSAPSGRGLCPREAWGVGYAWAYKQPDTDVLAYLRFAPPRRGLSGKEPA
jgi:hypothetical protein